MFTGIVRGLGIVQSIEDRKGLRQLTIELPRGTEGGLALGASIAVDGVCLTIAQFEERRVSFDVMQETLSKTTLGTLQENSRVNIERSAKEGAEIGGHLLSGHVDCTARVAKVDRPENNFVITFEVPPSWMRYIFPKGFIALNGASLTITNVNRSARTFEVWLIPETLRLTTFGEKKVGDLVNMEVERSTLVMVDTVHTFMEEKFGKLLPAIQDLLAKSNYP